MASLSCLTLVAVVGFTRAILFNATTFREEYMCEVNGRIVGQCQESAMCNTTTTDDAVDCGIDGRLQVCCSWSRAQRSPRGQLSRQKCLEYTEAVDVGTKCPDFRPFSGNNEALLNEYPHIAAIGYEMNDGSGELRWLCAGSLISERFVLTENVCAKGSWLTGPPRKVRLGDLDLNNPDDDDELLELDVAKIYSHRNHSRSGIYHNIALLKLRRDVFFSASVRPACLHTEPTIPATRGVAVGWGRTDNYYHVVVRRALRKVDLPFVSQQECDKLYNATKYLGFLDQGIHEMRSMLCAGELSGGKDTCMGDAGVPLMVKLAHPYCTYSIVGVAAFGSIPCGQPYKPSVFSRIYYYIPWIERIVWPAP